MPVYFIQAEGGGPIKIGWAKNVAKRVAEIQRMSPSRLCILNTFDCSEQDERLIHKYFNYIRLYGEWFEPTDSLLDFVQNPHKVELAQSIPASTPRFPTGPIPGTGVVFKLGELIEQKENIENRHITYRDISTGSGISTNTLSKIIGRKIDKIGLNTIDKLCKYFQCAPGDLFVFERD